MVLMRSEAIMMDDGRIAMDYASSAHLFFRVSICVSVMCLSCA